MGNLDNLEVPQVPGEPNHAQEFDDLSLMGQAFSPKKSKEEKRFYMLKEKIVKKYWIKKLARETYKLLPTSEDSNLIKRNPNTHKIKLVESKQTALISKWMSSETDDIECIYCHKKGEIALDFVSLVVGCGNCGEMAGVDYKSGEMYRGEDIEWYCYCCSLMMPTGGDLASSSKNKGVAGNGGEEKGLKVSEICFLCNNNIHNLGNLG